VTNKSGPFASIIFCVSDPSVSKCFATIGEINKLINLLFEEIQLSWHAALHCAAVPLVSIPYLYSGWECLLASAVGQASISDLLSACSLLCELLGWRFQGCLGCHRGYNIHLIIFLCIRIWSLVAQQQKYSRLWWSHTRSHCASGRTIFFQYQSPHEVLSISEGGDGFLCNVLGHWWCSSHNLIYVQPVPLIMSCLF